jgi:DUF1680 family protein
MLKLTRDLWTTDPSNTKYFDYYERALINHLLGAQDPGSNHGHVTYFTPLRAGSRRGVGPAWGGGTWSTDYDSFWCCQGTGVETNTKLMDSIYFYDNSAVYVNLFTPSTLDWSQRGVKISQSTTFPAGEVSTLTVEGTGKWAMKIRVPGWAEGAGISVNGKDAGVSVKAGSYATIEREWKSGDTISVKLPMKLHAVVANDNAAVAAIAYGPVVLSGNYGQQALSGMPTIALDSVKKTSADRLAFEGMADGKKVSLGPFYDAQGFNYVVYWKTSGQLKG